MTTEMNRQIKQAIDTAIDALIGGNWQPELYTAEQLLCVVREYEASLTDLHYRITIEDCADFMAQWAGTPD